MVFSASIHIIIGEVMKSIGIYIHIPFCEQKCPYCDFYSISKPQEYDRYTTELINRINSLCEQHKRTVDTIYFGGGTPSVIGSDRLINILGAVYNSFYVTDNCEVTVEVNPCSAGKLDFKAMRNAGFNRLSIGLQSSDEKELKLLGRRHTADDAKAVVIEAQKAGFDSISIDLMMCIPEQTKSSLYESIKFCKDCNVNHISVYILKIEENTPFYNITDKLELFSDDKQADFYTYAVDTLEELSYKQYEISNFSLTGHEGRHNLHYWRDEEYLGVGPSAHSFIDGKRFYYSRDINEFYKGTVCDDGTGGDIAEYIMLSLRLREGLSVDYLKEEYDYELNKNLIRALNNLSNEGLVDFTNNTLSLTKKGFLVSNSVINYIIDNL